ncbi:TniQ family protein [Dongia sp.]|uniref:TniQ family protein n=1 Tax=Dongia sp. TaxID=1977262 RepID=UPI0035B0171E
MSTFFGNIQTLEPGESLYGWVNRLAEAMDAPSYQAIWQLIGLNGAEGPLPRRVSSTLASAADCAPDEIGLHYWCGDDRARKLGTTTVPAWMIARSHTRFCPICVWEGRPHLAVWDFSPLPSCLAHNCHLTDICQVCGSGLRRHRRWFRHCAECGLPITANVRKAHAASARENRLATAIHSWLDKCKVSSGFPPDIQQLDLANLVLMARLVGSMAHDQQPAYHPRRAWLAEDAVRAAYGMELLRKWPNAFHRLLRTLETTAYRPLPFLNPSAHRLVSLRFRHEGDFPYAKLITAEIWNHAARQGIILPPVTYGYTPDDFAERFVSLRDGAKIANIPALKLAAIAKARRWLGHRQIGCRCPIWLRRDDIVNDPQIGIRPIYLVEAAKILGCNQNCLRRLIRLGHLTAPAADGVRNKKAAWHSTAADLEAFKVAIRERVAENQVRRAVSWRFFSRSHGNCATQHGDVIAAVIRGEVIVPAWETDRLFDLQFDPNSLADFIQPRAKQVSGSMSALAKSFGVPEAVLQAAVSAGLLRRPRGHLTRVLLSSFTSFVARYATVAMVAGPKRKDIWQLRKAARQINLTPIRSTISGDLIVEIFRREELLRAAASIGRSDDPDR